MENPEVEQWQTKRAETMMATRKTAHPDCFINVQRAIIALSGFSYAGGIGRGSCAAGLGTNPDGGMIADASVA
jgi:hypothetical protein